MLFGKPRTDYVKIIQTSDNHDFVFGRHLNGLGSVGRCQHNGFALHLLVHVGIRAITKVKSLNHPSIALSSYNKALLFVFQGFFHTGNRNDAIHTMVQSRCNSARCAQDVNHNNNFEILLIKVVLTGRIADLDKFTIRNRWQSVQIFG